MKKRTAAQQKLLLLNEAPSCMRDEVAGNKPHPILDGGFVTRCIDCTHIFLGSDEDTLWCYVKEGFLNNDVFQINQCTRFKSVISTKVRAPFIGA